MITGQVKDLCYGLYGKTATAINPEVQKKALKDYPRGEEPITCRPAEVLEPELEKAKEEVGSLAKDIDDVILYAQFPVTGKKFLEWKYGISPVPDNVKPISMEEVKKKDDILRKAKAGELIEKKGDTPAKSESSRTFNVFVDSEYFSVDVDPVGGPPMIMSQPIQPAVPQPVPAAAAAAPAPAQPASPEPAPSAPASGTVLLAPMPGMIVKYEKKIGDSVKKGDTVVVLEAMKMENALPAPCDGTIKAIDFDSGDTITKGAVLCVIG
jgi:oxaloacetate decarboxylase alpha subunit/pyruvate carboxylase subunit B